MIDKRFWSGAILAVTIIVAGASSLPALLLRPASPEPVPAAPAAVAKIATPVPAHRDAQPIPRADPLAAAPPQQIAIAEPAPKPAAPPLPQSAAVPDPAPATPVRGATPVVFPPVQPVGVAGSGAPEPAVQAAAPPPTESRPESSKNRAPEKAARAERRGQPAAQRKRNVVRPALYPLREFFAWRR